jgi:hypothetical protein
VAACYLPLPPEKAVQGHPREIIVVEVAAGRPD